MTAGIVLLILGAVFAFAIRSDGTWIDTRALGAILMLGGLAFVARSLVGRRGVVLEQEEVEGGAGPEVTERRVVIEKRTD